MLKKAGVLVVLAAVIGVRQSPVHAGDFFEDYQSGKIVDSKNVPDVFSKALIVENDSLKAEGISNIIDDFYFSAKISAADTLKLYKQIANKKSVGPYQRKRASALVVALKEQVNSKNNDALALAMDFAKKASASDKGPEPRHQAIAQYFVAYQMLSNFKGSNSIAEKNEAEKQYWLCKASAKLQRENTLELMENYFKNFPHHTGAQEVFEKYERIQTSAYREGSGPAEVPLEVQNKIKEMSKLISK